MANTEILELVGRMKDAATEWRDASLAWDEAAGSRDVDRIVKSGMRLSRAQNAWYLLAKPEQVMQLCDALSEDSHA